MNIKFDWVKSIKGARPVWYCVTRECTIGLDPLPDGCDIGQWIAIRVRGTAIENVFPRFYFDLDRAKLEIEALLRSRNYTPL